MIVNASTHAASKISRQQPTEKSNKESDVTEHAPNILRAKEVCKKIGLGRMTLWRMCKDGTFPQPVSLGRGNTVGWFENEVLGWQKSLKRV